MSTPLSNDPYSGNVLPNAIGPQITSAYNANTLSDSDGSITATTPIQVTPYAARRAMVALLCTLGSGSGITSLSFKFEVSDDRVNWLPVQSRNQATDGALSTAHEQTSLAVSAGATTGFNFTCAEVRGAPFLRVGVHANSTGSAGDVITATLTIG